MFYREIVAVCSQIHTKHINTLCGQDIEWCGTSSPAVLLASWPAGSLQTVATEAPQLVDTCQGARIENSRRVIVHLRSVETDEIICDEAKQTGVFWTVHVAVVSSARSPWWFERTLREICLLPDTCDVCDFTRVWYSSVNERFANPGRQFARAAKFYTLKLPYYSL